MSQLRKAAEMALEAMTSFSTGTNKMFEGEFAEEIQALRQALAQPEQEPFGYFRYDLEWDGWVETNHDDGKPLYTAPPKREWVGLTDEEQQELHDKWQKRMDGWGSFYQAVEQALKEKNT